MIRKGKSFRSGLACVTCLIICIRMDYFGAGPAALPEIVLQQAAEAVLNYSGTGISILELPHRSTAFNAILEEANSLVNDLCDLQNEYHILWLAGGGRMQFAMVPQNLLRPGTTAAYIDSGYWAHDAYQTALSVGAAEVVTSSRAEQYRSLPDMNSVSHSSQASGTPWAYLHQTTNNTIFGTQFKSPPPALGVPLIADMSSDILGVPRDYRAYDLFYAVAQKNLGPAGVTLVCIRKSLLPQLNAGLPPILSYQEHVAAGGILNTLPVFPIYTCLLTLRWLAGQGLSTLFGTNERKARLLYQAIDESRQFTALVAPGSRSSMNVVFKAHLPQAENSFLQFCADRAISGIEGHRSTGGFRASIYNGVSETAVQHLVSAIQEFDATFAS